MNKGKEREREREKRRLTVNVFRPVVGPAVAAVKGVEVGNVAVEAVLGELAAILLEAQVGKDAEPEPVGVGHAKTNQPWSLDLLIIIISGG